MPKYKQCRATTPAKVSLIIYGAAFQEQRSSSELSAPASDNRVISSSAAESADTRPMSEEPISGHPPKIIPRHGPGFLNLDGSDREELVRLHNNLGHPDTARFVRFLQERKAEPRLIQGARDFECSTCLETLPAPKLARPSAIHCDGDFGDTIGIDCAFWTNSAGQTFRFMHVLDEATLFHQGVGTVGCGEEQFAHLSDIWFRWAGPCRNMYIDPAGEYTSDFWQEQLQKQGIRARS